MQPRRLKPRIWDTDWLMLRGMAKVIGAHISEHVQAGDRVLDFGCGDMPYQQLAEAKGAHYSGADFGNHADISISSDGVLPTQDALFDVILSIQVLEHVRDLDTYFAEIRRVLKPEGRLILSTHGTWLYHPHPEDHWRWTRTGLELLIRRSGFEVVQMDSIVGPLATTTMIRLTGFSFFLNRIPIFGAAVAAALAMIMNIRGLVEDAVTPSEVKQDNGSVYVTLCRAKKP